MKTRITITIALLAALSAGCASTRELHSEQQHDQHTTTAVREAHDSVYIYSRDSVFMLVRGDTVVVDRWHVRYRDRLVVRVDSVTRVDSVFSEVRITEVVQPSRWQVFWAQFGKIALGLIIVYIAVKSALKWLKK